MTYVNCLSPCLSVLDRGMSREAQTVRLLLIKPEEQSPSISLNDKRQSTLEALIAAFNEATSVGWNGYSSSPANHNALLYAIQLLENLPGSIPVPEIAVDNDGDIAIEWDYGPRRIFSIRVGPDGSINYSGLIGFSSFHGVETFTEYLPQAISEGISRVGKAS